LQGSGYKNKTYYKGKLTPTPGYYWSGASSNDSNDWSISTLNTDILNGTYLTALGNNWASKIATANWKIGGNTASLMSLIPAAKSYQNEVINPQKNVNGKDIAISKVELMYVSDYAFAASQENWTTSLNSYNNDTNRKNNWLFLGIFDCTISPNLSSDSTMFIVYYDGNVTGTGVFYSLGVRPTFYLNSNIVLTGGIGTETNPYRVN